MLSMKCFFLSTLTNISCNNSLGMIRAVPFVRAIVALNLISLDPKQKILSYGTVGLTTYSSKYNTFLYRDTTEISFYRRSHTN